MAKPTIPEVIERFREYHRKPGNLAWGSLHIVLDDGNVEDAHVAFCVEHAEAQGDTEGAELARILLAMSKTQRSKIGRLAHQPSEGQ
jgi:hypothetical protein